MGIIPAITGKIELVYEGEQEGAEVIATHLIEKAIQETIATGEGQTFWMKSIGVDEKGVQVSEMDFEWSVRIK